MWDVGGGDKIRALKHYYYDGIHGGIFMIDSNDRGRIDTV